MPKKQGEQEKMESPGSRFASRVTGSEAGGRNVLDIYCGSDAPASRVLLIELIGRLIEFRLKG